MIFPWNIFIIHRFIEICDAARTCLTRQKNINWPANSNAFDSTWCKSCAVETKFRNFQNGVHTNEN